MGRDAKGAVGMQPIVHRPAEECVPVDRTLAEGGRMAVEVAATTVSMSSA